MSSITFADNKTGGRITACCDAIAAGHLNRAAGILAELADELNVEATQTGLLSEETQSQAPIVAKPEVPQLATAQPASDNSMDLQMCARGVHSFGPPAPVTGWRTCAVCETVNVAPPEDNGPPDINMRDGRW